MARRTALTLEQFLALPEVKPHREYREGVVTRKAWPGGRHSALQGGATALIGRLCEPACEAMAFLEVTTVFAGSALVPDVAIVA